MILFLLIALLLGSVSEATRIRSPSGYSLERLAPARSQEIGAQLLPASFDVLFHGKTEPPYTGRFLSSDWSLDGPRSSGFKEEGVFVNPIGKLPLFNTTHKFISGTGWPSFYDCFDKEHVQHLILPGNKGFTEVLCARTGLHLGHCFPDKPPPVLKRQLEMERGGPLGRFEFQRFCINACSIEFVPSSQLHLLEQYRD